MLKIAITVEDPRISPPETMSELGVLLTHVGSQVMGKGGALTDGEASVTSVFGPARVIVEPPKTDQTDSLRETAKGEPTLRIDIGLGSEMFCEPDIGLAVHDILQTIGGNLMHEMTDREADSGEARSRIDGAVIARWEVVTMHPPCATMAPKSDTSLRDRLTRRLTWRTEPDPDDAEVVAIHGSCNLGGSNGAITTTVRVCPFTTETDFWPLLDRMQTGLLNHAEEAAPWGL